MKIYVQVFSFSRLPSRSSLRLASMRAVRTVSANMYRPDQRISFDALFLCGCRNVAFTLNCQDPIHNTRHICDSVCLRHHNELNVVDVVFFFIHRALCAQAFAAVEMFIPFVFLIRLCVLRIHISSSLTEWYWLYWSKCVFTIEIKRTEHVNLHSELG